MYKIVAYDLDDTLLKDDCSISTINKEIILKVVEKGIIDPTSNEVIYSNELEKGKIRNIIKYAEMHNVHINIYDDYDKIYVKEKNKWTEFYKSFSSKAESVEVGSIEELVCTN